MENITIKISMLGYWYIGTGHEAGAYADSVVLKDVDNLPYIPGKTLKGMFKNAARYCELNEDYIKVLFGEPGSSLIKNKGSYTMRDLEGIDELNTSGILSFNSAELTPDEKEQISNGNYHDYLYRTVQSTAIDKDGVAKDKSLRTIEVTIPLTFETEINLDTGKKFQEQYESADEVRKQLKTMAAFITEIGGKRRRGFGRCLVEVL